MFKTRLALFLVVLLVVFVGLAVLTAAVIHSGDSSLAFNVIKMGHVCGSTCTI